MIGCGPVMRQEALGGSELLRDRGFGLRVINLPWLKRIDLEWFGELVRRYERVYVVEDHATVGGLGEFLRRSNDPADRLARFPVPVFGVDGYPACGRPGEVLAHHRLDGSSIADRVLLEAD